MALPFLNPNLGPQVSSRQFSLLEMVERSWGSEFRAPDHGVYQFSNGRRFDSTDIGSTGIYRNPSSNPQFAGWNEASGWQQSDNWIP